MSLVTFILSDIASMTGSATSEKNYLLCYVQILKRCGFGSIMAMVGEFGKNRVVMITDLYLYLHLIRLKITYGPINLFLPSTVSTRDLVSCPNTLVAVKW